MDMGWMWGVCAPVLHVCCACLLTPFNLSSHGGQDGDTALMVAAREARPLAHRSRGVHRSQAARSLAGSAVASDIDDPVERARHS